jgi:hypothetical protein
VVAFSDFLFGSEFQTNPLQLNNYIRNQYLAILRVEHVDPLSVTLPEPELQPKPIIMRPSAIPQQR